MAGPGYSVTDLIQAVKKVKDIYDAFFDEYQNAPRKLGELQKELQRLQEELQGLKQIEQETGKSYTGRDALQSTLDECETFLESHKSALVRSRAGLGRSDTTLRVLKTGLFAFEQENFERLLDNLSRRRIELIGFYVLLLLHKSLRSAQPQSSISIRRPSVSSVTTTQSSSSTRTRSSFDETAVRSCIVELRSIGNALTRVGGGDNADLDKRLQHTVTKLTDLTGLPTGLIPLVPVSEFAQRSHQSMWQTILTTGAGAPSRYTSARKSETISHTCEIYIQRGQHVTQAVRYTMMSDTLHRYCYFFDAADNQIMVHHLPRDCYPYTYHGMFHKPLQVTFKSTVRVVPPLPGDQQDGQQPVYRFQRLQDAEVFQSNVRNRDLTGKFDVDEVSCAIPENCQAEFVQVKLWRSRRDPTSTSLSFRTKQLEFKDLDIRLRYLRITATEPPGSTCKLDFTQGSKLRQSSQTSINTLGTPSTQRAFDVTEYIRLMQYIRLDFPSSDACAEFVYAFRDAQMDMSRPPSIRTVSTSTATTPSNWTLSSSPNSERLRPLDSRTSTGMSTPGTSPFSSVVSPLEAVPRSTLPPAQLGSSATGLVGMRDVASQDELAAATPALPEPQIELQTGTGVTPSGLFQRAIRRFSG
ncbi:hypothetical protein LTR15_004702 [Elasticomyces elasticus]|nr:hypothetical protein LTR15_004702 [Elasticomyces elasticus]